VVAFCPADWSPVCGDQMALYNEALPEFEQYGATILGISVDGAWCHDAFAKSRHLHFPLLADFEPKGAVARQYGAYREADGFCQRTLFVIDRDGTPTFFINGRPLDAGNEYADLVAAIDAELATETNRSSAAR
jgi:peroxiredoxin